MPPPAARRAVTAAYAALLWERAAPIWAPPALAVLAVLAMAAIGLLQPLPDWVHAGVSLGLISLVVWPTWRAIAAFRRPGLSDARRRAEADSHLRHAPLATLDDDADGGEPALWALHRARAAEATARARPRRPKAGLAAADPYALRFALPLLLALGLFAAGDQGPRRLQTAFRPDLKADSRPLTVEAWAAPPAYTRRPPQPLSADTPAVELPQGTVLTLTVRGAASPPSVSGARFHSSDGAYVARLRLRQSRPVEVRRGGRLARWRVRVLPDQQPRIAFAAPPARGEGDALALLYTAADDHGVAEVTLRLRSGLSTVDRPLDLPAAPDAPQLSAVDLTDTPLAGRTVQAQLIATDAAGQVARSRPLRVRVPERLYTDPAAKAVADAARILRREWRPYSLVRRPAPEPPDAVGRRLRATLGPYYALHAAPPGVRAAAAEVSRLLEGGGPPLPDAVAAAGLTWTLRRLAAAQGVAAARAYAPELIAIAERIERGPTGSAKDALRQAQRRLREAVARGAPPEEVARLLEEVKQAMAAYLAALQRQPAPPGDPAGEGSITDADLDALWREVEAALARGDTERAMALMDAIAQLLASIQPGGGEGPGGQGAAARALGPLQDRQSALGDETFGSARGDPSRDVETLAREQQVLAAAAAQARRWADDGAAAPLAEAEAAMTTAADALSRYDIDAAVRAQRRAQTALAGAARALSAQQAAGGLMDQALGEADPLGRRTGGGGSAGEGRTTPDDPALDARQALDAIRARAADRSRPDDEHRYLERLLERF